MVCLALAGGVGGARMAHGLAMVLPPEELMVAVNIGDDFTHLGLRICPDLDTVMYTFSGQADPETGWGIKGETWSAMAALENLGGPTWFRLGDRDLATHLERTQRLAAGETLSDITQHLSTALGIHHRIIPVSDTPVPTVVETEDGDLAFQDYFVKLQCDPAVTGFRFDGASGAMPSPPLLDAMTGGKIDAAIICPSNPYVSIDPVLAIPGVRELLNPIFLSLRSLPSSAARRSKGPQPR